MYWKEPYDIQRKNLQIFIKICVGEAYVS
jgi:hypothetical protein